MAQVPLQQAASVLHGFPYSLQAEGAAAAPPTPPREASAPPTRAAPINLSALPRETSPLASPLARASKERSLGSSNIGSILSLRSETRQPRFGCVGVADPGLERGQVAILRPHVVSSCHVTAAAYSWQRGGRITQLQYLLHFPLRNFGESPKGEVRRILLPRTTVNKGKKREGRGGSRPRCALALRLRNVYRSSKTVESRPAQMHSAELPLHPQSVRLAPLPSSARRS